MLQSVIRDVIRPVVGSVVNPKLGGQQFMFSSGLIRYRWGLDKTANRFYLDYSEDGSLTWTNLDSQVVGEDTPLQNINHLYHFSIVDYVLNIDDASTGVNVMVYDGYGI
jgi:hypothetical protein